ncbi:MAG TPA: SEC-C domain-containing protein [Polyangiaceae bacterium]|nr:SEC-C domain-containing protein [Polyangiaceae bacterium]
MAFLQHNREANTRVLADLEQELTILQGLVAKYDAVGVMHRAAYELFPLLMQYRSENEFRGEEPLFLATVEYLQYLIARTEKNVDGNAPSEEEWGEIWKHGLQVMRLTQSHLIVRGTMSVPPTEIDELRFMLDQRRLMVRVQRYPLFFEEHLRSSLDPYEKQIRDIYGIGVDEIVEGLRTIENYQRTGVAGRYRDVGGLLDAGRKRLIEIGHPIDPGAPPDEVMHALVATENEGLNALREAAIAKWVLTFTPALFEITALTSLPKPFLSLLSVRPGESVLKVLTGPDHDDLSPLSTSVLHYKPFLEVDGRFYFFYHSGFEDHIPDILEADLFAKRPGEVSEMAKKRSDQLESDARSLLCAIVHPDFALQNVYYPNPDESGGLTELDLLIGVDDVLLIVEAKAGGFSAPASRGAPKSIAQDLSDLIIEGQRQSERAERFIRSGSEVAFLDSTGKNEVLRLQSSKFRTIHRVAISREDLGWVGAKIAILSILDPGLSKSYPWHVSIDDLRIVAELFKDDEIRFFHYLELRLLASAQKALTQHDEIDHVALYNNMNYYHELPAPGVDRLSYDGSYMRDIDNYFMGRVIGEQRAVPTQEIPPHIREFIAALRVCRLPHRFEAGSILLSMNGAGRDEINAGLDAIEAGRVEGRQRSIRTASTESMVGLSITCVGDALWSEELKLSAVQMERSRCERWAVVQVADKSPYAVTGIEVVTPRMFADDELVNPRLRLESRTTARIARQKPGRNERCPCGSGQKFKRCHGKP